MKHTTILLALLLAFSGCKRIKDTATTDKSKVNTETTSQTNETITTEERIDTIIQIVERVDSAVKYISTTDTVYIDNEFQRVVVKVDTVTKHVYVKATIKERYVPVQKIKKVVAERVVKETESVKAKIVEKSKVKVKTVVSWWWWLLIALVVGGYVYFKYFSPLKLVISKRSPP